jgi:hypothetical protein
MKENTEEEPLVIPDYMADLVDFVEEQYGKLESMDGRKKKEREALQLIINQAVDKVNTLAGSKIYKKC